MAEATQEPGAFSGFDAHSYLPDKLWDAIVELRVLRPEAINKDFLARRKREKLTHDGKLVLLMCDDPARMVTDAGGDPLRMGNRREYLARILRVITDPRTDGLIATTDVIDDLMAVNHIFKESGGKDFLDHKVLVGSLNRGGLAGSAFELDDAFTAFTPKGALDRKLDAAKVTLRLNLSSEASRRTLEACAQAMGECASLGLPVVIEAMTVELRDGRYTPKRTPEDLVRIAGVATALGWASHGTWLSLPACEQFERVALATTCPILLLEGESWRDPRSGLEGLVSRMKAGSNVRGAVMDRGVLFPGDDDPLAIATAVDGIVRQGASAEAALELLQAERGKNADIFAQKFS